MRYQHHYLTFILFLSVSWAMGCQQAEKKPAEEAPEPTQTPVTVAAISTEPLTEYIELNASSAFLQKNFVKANANGYLQSNFSKPGQYVSKGQVLFTIKTKEAQSIGNAVNQLDSSFRFSGTNPIKAGEQGYITQLNHQAGDYVQDGEQLAVVSDLNSFVFLLDLPYELRPFMQRNKTIELVLPDGEKLTGTVAGSLPSVDIASQTQNLFIKVNAGHPIPENLIAKVRIIKNQRLHAVSVPKAAVLTDETQSGFWIMKMTDSTTAVKTPVKKGMESNDRIEILSPALSATDKIILTGQYGLPDTAKVKIIVEP